MAIDNNNGHRNFSHWMLQSIRNINQTLLFCSWLSRFNVQPRCHSIDHCIFKIYLWECFFFVSITPDAVLYSSDKILLLLLIKSHCERGQGSQCVDCRWRSKINHFNFMFASMSEILKGSKQFGYFSSIAIIQLSDWNAYWHPLRSIQSINK